MWSQLGDSGWGLEKVIWAPKKIRMRTQTPLSLWASPCNQCDKTFLKEKSLIHHIKSMHDYLSLASKRIKGSGIGLRFSSSAPSCSQCNDICVKEKSLKEHMKSKHDQGRGWCGALAGIGLLTGSLMFFSPLAPSCNKCHKTFEKEKSLKHHMKSKH